MGQNVYVDVNGNYYAAAAPNTPNDSLIVNPNIDFLNLLIAQATPQPAVAVLVNYTAIQDGTTVDGVVNTN